MNPKHKSGMTHKRILAGVLSLTITALLFTACRTEPEIPTIPAVTDVTTTAKPTIGSTTASASTTTTATSTTTATTTDAPSTQPPSTAPTDAPATTPTTIATQAPVSTYWSDGVTPSVWKANCNEYITLRSDPYSDDAIATIPSGDTMILLDWYDVYAKVSYRGQEGYVLANWIAPVDGINCLSVVPITNVYTYEQMCADINTFCARYPSLCRRGSIGKSELGRDIPLLKLGSESASHHVLVQGAIHGLEHLTAWVVMGMVDTMLSRGAVPMDVCFHIIPMSNPDGVTLAQTGLSTATQRAIYAADLAAGYTWLDEATYASEWKANGLGVDLNRNFDAGWAPINGHTAPSSERYKGETPFSACEARALRDYTLSRHFDATISYHAMGSIIYYEFGSAQPVNDLSYDLGYAVRNVTGYPLIGSDSVEGGGYKDWAMEALGIPSLTIEVGCTATPLAYQEIYNVLYRNLSVFNAVAQWVKQH